MNILLIYPGMRGTKLLPPYSLAALSAMIRERSQHKVSILDLTWHTSFESVVDRAINEFCPDVVGLSVVSHFVLPALEISRHVKEKYGIPIIWGGVHPTLATDDVMRNNCIDFVAIGEADYTLLEFLDSGLKPNRISGLAYRDGSHVVVNTLRPVPEDLDALPFPDWSDFDMEKYFLLSNNHMPIMVSRGCPYRCTYCSNHALKKLLPGKYVRFRSPARVLNECEHLYALYRDRGLKYLFFYDDTFILKPDFVFEFCSEYKLHGLHRKLLWNVNVRADLIREDIVKAMAEAGCYRVRMGVEAGNEAIRNELYKRGMSNDDIMKAVAIIKRYNVQLRVQFIIGAPWEDLASLEETFELAKRIDPDHILFPILQPLPGTEIRQIAKESGLLEDSVWRDPKTMYTSSMLRTEYLSRDEIDSYARKLNYYFRWKMIAHALRTCPFRFLRDCLVFFAYYRPMYHLEMENAFRFSVNRYLLEEAVAARREG